MELTNKNDFIQRFRETHKLQIKAYIKPEIKSEKVFTVGYDISPFNLSRFLSWLTFVNTVINISCIRSSIEDKGTL